MKLSPDKAGANFKCLDSFTLRTDDHCITFSDELKILGVNFDNTCNFSTSVTSAQNVLTK